MNAGEPDSGQGGAHSNCGDRRLEWLPLGLILAVFLATQVSLFHQHRLPYADAETDTFGYLATARGPWFEVHDYQPPGFPILIRVLSATTGLPLFEAGKCVSMVSGALWIVSGWFLFRAMVPTGAALLATWLLAFQHLTVFYSCAVLSDLMGAALFLTSITLLVAPSKTRLGVIFLSGLAAGAAYFTRYAFVVLLALPVLWYAPSLLPVGARMRAGKKIALFLLGFSLINLPWWIFLYEQTGHLLWSRSYLVVAHHVYGQGHPTSFEEMANRFSGFGQVLIEDPGRFARTVFGTLVELPGRWQSLGPSFWVLAGTGALTWMARLDWRRVTFSAITLLYLLLTSMVHYEGRYQIPALPWLMGMVAAGVVVLPKGLLKKVLPADWMRDYRNLTLLALGIGYALHFLSTSNDWVAYTVGEEEPVEYREAAAWLGDNAKPGAGVLSAKPHIAVWKGLTFLSFRRDLNLDLLEPEDLGPAVSQTEADFLVFDERVAGRYWPQFAFLLDPGREEVPSGLKPVSVIDRPKKLVVYRIERPAP